MAVRVGKRMSIKHHWQGTSNSSIASFTPVPDSNTPVPTLVYFNGDVFTHKEKMNGLTCTVNDLSRTVKELEATVNELSHTVKELAAEKERLEQRMKKMEEFLAWWNFRSDGST